MLADNKWECWKLRVQKLGLLDVFIRDVVDHDWSFLCAPYNL
jgi:hypothetical protein